MDRTQQALDFIKTCCRYVGRFDGMSAVPASDVYRYLKETARAMEASQPSALFPERYIEHVAYALDMVASNLPTSSPAAIASLYLATRFEFYFRILSGKLNRDGTWVSPSEHQRAQAAIMDPRLKGKLGGKQISSVALAYKIMKLNKSCKISQSCTALDDALYATPTIRAGKIPIADIGDRIEFCRNAAGHGNWGDISAEAVFYGLMTALIFHNQ